MTEAQLHSAIRLAVAVAVAIPAAVVAVAVAAPAHADENSYLADLNQHGIKTLDPAQAVRDGHGVCNLLRMNMQPWYAALDMQKRYGMSYEAALYLVGSAERNLC
jgi:hypothetical protein